MTETLPRFYLTKTDLLQKYRFITYNMLKNMLFKDINGFRNKVVRKIGKRLLFDEEAFLTFIRDSK